MDTQIFVNTEREEIYLEGTQIFMNCGSASERPTHLYKPTSIRQVY